MSLLEDARALLKEEPTACDLSELGAEAMSDEYQDSSRWTEHWTAVYRRGDEFVALDYELPATEEQEGSEADSEVYEVVPRVEIIERVVYDRVTNNEKES